VGHPLNFWVGATGGAPFDFDVRDFQGIYKTTRLSFGMAASPQNPLPFRPARSL